MSAPALSSGTAETAPHSRIRYIGVVYLLFFLTAILGELMIEQAGISGFSVSSNTAATAQRLLEHETSYWIGFALGLISTACYVALVALFYLLFRPVNRAVALLAACFGLIGCAVTAVGGLTQLAPLVILKGGSYLSAFSAEQVRGLVLLFLNLNAHVGGVALVFFGLFQLMIGYLIFRSSFLPRALGPLIALAGLGWLTVLWPPLASLLTTPVDILGIVAEGALMLWLLIVGVNTQRWREHAGAASRLA